MDPVLWEELNTDRDESEEIEAFVRLDQPGVDVSGVRIITRFGPIATCRVRRDSILRIHGESSVLSLKGARGIGPEPEFPPDESFPPELIETDIHRPRHLSLTGRGVVIGIIDFGCDFNHPDFKTMMALPGCSHCGISATTTGLMFVVSMVTEDASQRMTSIAP